MCKPIDAPNQKAEAVKRDGFGFLIAAVENALG